MRLLDSNVPPHVRVLLEAGRDAEPHSSLVETTLQSLRVANLGAAPSSLSSLTSSVVIPVLAGVLALGALVGLTWSMMAQEVPRLSVESSLQPTPSEEAATPVEAPGASHPAPSAQAVVGSTAGEAPGEERSARVIAAVPSARPTSPPEPTASASVPAGDSERKRARSSTLAQRDLVLRARAALDGGAPQRALSILTGYETAFDELRFVPEVLSLRMQAHQRMGNVAAAQQLARSIIAMYPRSSQAGRARQLLRDAATPK